MDLQLEKINRLRERAESALTNIPMTNRTNEAMAEAVDILMELCAVVYQQQLELSKKQDDLWKKVENNHPPEANARGGA